MKSMVGYRRDFWLMIAIGSVLVVLVILLGVSFFKAISDSETKSKREFLMKQTELAATEIEIELDRFEVNAKSLIEFLGDEDLDEDDYREEFTNAVRRVFNNYPRLIDTVWVNFQDSIIYFTQTDRNDFIRSRAIGNIPSKRDHDFIFSTGRNTMGFELTFTLSPVRFTKDFVTHYYLNEGGSKLLMLGDKLENLDPGQDVNMLEIDDASLKKIQADVEIGVIGIYEIDWVKGSNSGSGILVQYPFNLGEFYDNTALLFMVESDSITGGIYSTYLFLFSGFVFLLIGTVIFFTLSLQTNLESQKLLKESAEEISELFDQQNLLLKELRGFVFFHNAKGQITQVSDEVEKVLGHPKSEFLDAFRNEDGHLGAINIKSLVNSALSQNQSFFDVEYDFHKPDGTKVHLRIFEKLVFDEEGVFNGGLGICTDITSQYRSNQELIESGKRLQNLIDNIPDIIFIYNNEGKVLDSHSKDQKFLKSVERSLIGDSLFDLVPKKQREQTQFAFKLARKTEQIQTVDLKINLREHENQYFEVRFFPLDTKRMMSISKDITSQRIWEKGLVDAMNAADLASRAKSEFLANMSHEIRTPMNGLLGIIDLLDQTSLDEEQLQYLDIIKNSGNSLLSIIKDILDYSKIEAGKIEINSIVFSPAEELEKQVQIFYGLAQKKDVILTTVLGSGTKDLMEGDVEKINQVILNLVGNAMKFTSKGGTVTVQMEIENISGDLNYLRCSVTDNGIGIPQEEIAKLTDPFYQVESSSSRSYQGTGLGLAIAKKIVELMGGELTISSEFGIGAVFAFSVILKKAKFVKENPLSELPKRTNWNGMAKEYPARILLAEDNDLNLQLMTLMLDQLGYDFAIAKNGFEVLDLVKSEEFDMILMDVQMPLLNGLEASKKIRALGERGEIFIIGLSANVFDEDQRKATDAGMDDYLTKPIRLVLLAEKIKEYFLKKESKKVQ
ncbi:ATP-binding protein [Algoriphagus aquimarinus]|uniref:ATP-binding protein n=1 Tax=Algoriphagus aquimarinus TaxID=237018 RepID=UPI0030D90B50